MALSAQYSHPAAGLLGSPAATLPAAAGAEAATLSLAAPGLTGGAAENALSTAASAAAALQALSTASAPAPADEAVAPPKNLNDIARYRMEKWDRALRLEELQRKTAAAAARRAAVRASQALVDAGPAAGPRAESDEFLRSSLLFVLRAGGTAAAASSLAEVATIPFDTAKVRMQLAKKATSHGGDAPGAGPKPPGVFGTIGAIASSEGPGALFRGLGAGIQHQVVNGSVRIGLYGPLKATLATAWGVFPSSWEAQLAAGLVTGGVAIACSNPIDVVKVRMQAAGGGAAKSSLAWYGGIIHTEGVRGLWSGLGANMTRGAIVNAVELSCYDQLHTLAVSGLGPVSLALGHSGAAVVAGSLAGCIAAVFATPLDVVKSRAMSEGAVPMTSVITSVVPGGVPGGDGLAETAVAPAAAGVAAALPAAVEAIRVVLVGTAGPQPPRPNVVQRIAAIWADEGPGALMKGFEAKLFRLASFNGICFAALDSLHALFDATKP